MTNPGPGMFIKSEWTAPNGSVFEMQHRYEDRALIIEVIQAHRPHCAVEFGTALGGFTALLAETVGAFVWDGKEDGTVMGPGDSSVVWSFDKTLPKAVRTALDNAYPNLFLVEADLLADDWNASVGAEANSTAYRVLFNWQRMERSRTLLYTDNGNKVEEITRFAPLLKVGDMLGTHDYATEVPVDWVEPFLAELGFTQHRHGDFAALADPRYYPASLTRFWLKGDA